MNSKQRIQKLFKYIEFPLDAIIIKNGSEKFIDSNFFYITGITNGLFESSCLVLYPNGSLDIITTELESNFARKSTADIHIYQSKTEMTTIINELLKESQAIGFHASGLLYSDYQWMTSNLKEKSFKDVTKELQKTRLIKDSDEIIAIKKACEIADKVMDNITLFVKKQMAENELAAEIDYHLQRYGAQHPAFDTIASFGSNTALPHYTHGNKKLKEGDFILCDFGAVYNNYHSDITRTFVYGNASETQKQIHHTVLNTQKQALMMIRPGLQANTIHESVRSQINATPFKDRFIHSTGHSIGMSVHDPGITLSSICNELLQENMVLTIEPGIYIQGLGGVRIEDEIVVTLDGCSRLTTTTRELQEI
jgi:Xaa-Pro dipeptidase